MMEQAAAKLISKVRACSLCVAKLPFGANPVLQFDPRAKILIAGQAPGKRVHETGIPFNDPSGDRLRQWLGIDREIFYQPKLFAIIPMGFCYPGTGKSGDLPPIAVCATTWRKLLLAQLTNVQLTLVIGSYAKVWHLPASSQSNLTATVKAWRDYWPEILPLPHPSPRNNLWLSNNPWFEQEILPPLKQRVTSLLNR